MYQWNESDYQRARTAPAPLGTDQQKEPWSESLARALVSAEELEKLIVTPRSVIIAPWLLEADLGFIFAARGVGKTWLGIHLAHCIAGGADCGPWKVLTPSRVLYMDGEMPLQDVQARSRALAPLHPVALSFLNHELLYERTSRILDLADSGLQRAVIELCTAQGYKVLILDNLSTLVTGVDENKAIDWEKILPWLLTLRRNHVTVVFIHHAGRNNQMRGSSKREDPSAWIINLKTPKNDPEREIKGAAFITSFEKCRNASERPRDIQWNFSELPNGEILVRHCDMSPLDVFVDLVVHGVDACKDIAEEMDCSCATVTRLAQKAEKRKLISITGRKYKPSASSSGPRYYDETD